MERLINAIPYMLQCISGVSPDTFKGHLDKWLRAISDTPKIGNYGAPVPAESNSLCDQAKQVGQAGDPNVNIYYVLILSYLFQVLTTHGGVNIWM